jgi:hypothetical protein
MRFACAPGGQQEEPELKNRNTRTANASAQTIGYRQTNLASSVPNVANNVTPGLANPWGIAAAPGSTITLTANINSPSGVPTGQIVFLDGNTSLGTSLLDGTGVATRRINTLAAGTHTLTASYHGDGKFGTSTSAGVTLDIANPDFSVGAAPPSASDIAGQSTQFILTVTPVGGFAGNVTLSCAPVTRITCSFSPATLTPANGAASTRLTVTTSAAVSR